MPESKEQRITRLLAEGLDHYGEGNVPKAILTWEEVLVLDPANTDAKDYIRTADRRKAPRPPKEGQLSPALRSILLEVGELVQAERFGEALGLLRSAAEAESSCLEIQSFFDLVRIRLLCEYRAQVGDPSLAPSQKAGATDLTKFNLPPDAGFLLSMIDGQTSVTDLISLSGMDDFEALHLLFGLRDAGLVELRS